MSRNPQLQAYLDLLVKWQAKINLISPQTLNSAWGRHFEDSLQILEFISTDTKILMDLGSGAGFPGLVLAIERPDIAVHLVESDQKKCSFLKAVSRETERTVSIHNMRIEDFSRETEIVPDVITARALASLDRLLGLCQPWWTANRDITLIFPKGEQAEQEIAQAKKMYDFNLEKFTSRTDKNGQVLVLTDIRLCE